MDYGLGLSLLTNRIMAGKKQSSKKVSDGLVRWASPPEDITEQAIKAVFEYMWNESKETGEFHLEVVGMGKMSFKREASE
jgi:hypothetical protein